MSRDTAVTPEMSTATASAEQEALRASTFQRLHPRAYYERFVAQNLRPDGREFEAWRPVSLNIGAVPRLFCYTTLFIYPVCKAPSRRPTGRRSFGWGTPRSSAA